MSRRALLACGGPPPVTYIEDVFNVTTYTATGASLVLTTGVDLATKGGMIWATQRTPANAQNKTVIDTVRGRAYSVFTDATAAQATSGSTVDLVSFDTTGITLGASSQTYINYASGVASDVVWSFAVAPKFYYQAQVTVSGSDQTVDLSSLGTVGMVTVKKTDGTSAWFVFHRSCTSGKLVYLNTTAAETTDGSITVSGTTLTLVQAVIGNGTYIVYAWAHDDSATGLIQCGSYSIASSPVQVTLGWEPQYLLLKRTDSTGGWFVVDTARGLTAEKYQDLNPNDSTVEPSAQPAFGINATGFLDSVGFAINSTFIYLAIRRPNKPPTTGTQVYNAIARTGTGGTISITGAGLAPDLIHTQSRDSYMANGFFDRLRGGSRVVYPSATTDEGTANTSVTSFDADGFTATTSVSYTNDLGQTYCYHFFRRAPGVMDQICTTGTGANKTEAHNLTVAPELWLHKGRSGATEWVFGSTLLANTEKIVCPSPAGKVTDATAWNSTYPTASVISFGTAAAVNTASATYTTYMWATLTGISKVGLFTKAASANKDVDCGFSAGARFVMLVRVDAAGDIYLYDTVRGIVAGNDPYLLLNTTAAEVTTTDWIDPLAAGFTIVDGGLPNGDYLFLAYA